MKSSNSRGDFKGFSKTSSVRTIGSKIKIPGELANFLPAFSHKEVDFSFVAINSSEIGVFPLPSLKSNIRRGLSKLEDVKDEILSSASLYGRGFSWLSFDEKEQGIGIAYFPCQGDAREILPNIFTGKTSKTFASLISYSLGFWEMTAEFHSIPVVLNAKNPKQPTTVLMF